MKAKPKADPVAALVDEYGRLEAKLAPYRADLKREEQLAKLLRGAAAEADPESPFLVKGERYEVTLGIAGMRTVIAAPRQIMLAIGQKLFLKCANVTLKALEENAHPLQVAKLTSREQTGPRAISVRTKETLAKAA